MSTSTRREFLQSTIATGAALATASVLTPRAWARRDDKAAKPLKILILGGTGFLGPACVDAAQARGHTLTLFNRGVTEKRKGGMFPDMEKLVGDRDPKKGEGLKALEGRKWDAVIDTSSYVPRITKASCDLLAPNCGQYVLISTVSVYKNNDKEGLDESDELATIADPTVEEMGKEFENYGPLKALCEQTAEKIMPGRVCNIRPGFIVGPNDPTDRWNYWPWRIAKGGEVLAPGTPADPVQIIDVRDLGEWIVHCIENNINGVYNAVGPNKPLNMGQMLDDVKTGVGGDAKFTWVDAETLEKNGAQPPIWVPPKGEMKGFHTRSAAKAIAKGLKSRAVSDTAKATLEWLKTLPEDRQKRLTQPKAFPAEKEAEILASVKAK